MNFAPEWILVATLVVVLGIFFIHGRMKKRKKKRSLEEELEDIMRREGRKHG